MGGPRYGHAASFNLAEADAAGALVRARRVLIDPTRAVDRAVITHAHSDHARPGHRSVLASADTLALMLARLGEGRAGETQQALKLGGDIRQSVRLQPGLMVCLEE